MEGRNEPGGGRGTTLGFLFSLVITNTRCSLLSEI
jgi:hypothetical protein